ncbi:MAG: hypothetical protein RL417_367 [Pseudomonadota bacterium]|jgi:ABC-type nitrate/sulfonate/bicarbonate transport system substrate-binding protein
MNRFRLVIIVATATMAFLGLTGCGSDGDSSRLSVQLSWIKNSEFAGEYFADTNGYYAEAGFGSVNLISGPTDTGAAVLAGEALVGIDNAVSTAQSVSDGAPLKIIGATYQKNPFSILSIKNRANIRNPRDMIGKRIGIQPGDNEALFDAFLRANNISASSVTKVTVGYDPTPLVNNEVDGFLAFITNESITVQNLGYEVRNMLFADNGLPFVAEAFVATQDAIDTERAALKRFLKATIRGWKDALANPDEGARLAVEVYGADLGLDINKEKQQSAAQNELLIVSDETTANGLFTISPALQSQNIASLQTAGYDITAAELFDLSLLEEVYAENPELRE